MILIHIHFIGTRPTMTTGLVKLRVLFIQTFSLNS